MYRTADGKVRRTPAEWRAMIQRFASSNLTQAAFSRREGVAVQSLQRWQRRLARSPFVELTPPPEPAPQWSVEVELAGGTILRLRG